MIHSMVFAIAILGAMVGTTQAQLIEKQALTLKGAKQIVAVAEAKAKLEGARVVIAVVDEGGNLLLLQRLDDTQVASVNVGIDKARTAAIFRRPSKVFEERARGRTGVAWSRAVTGGRADRRRRTGDRRHRGERRDAGPG